MKKIKPNFSTTHIIMFSFIVVIIVGAILLTLPISSANGQWTSFVDALFTATTSTCVTGLVVVPTAYHWSTFGHIVILTLIQIGGLGIITVIAGLSVMLHKKFGLANSTLIHDAFNLNSLSGLAAFIKKVILGTAFVEAVGALFYMLVFVPRFGIKGIWFSIFTSISAFCNAGIDIFANNSLCDFVHNPIVNFTTCMLIILGGLGFVVWWDVIRVAKLKRSRKVKFFKALTLHSKIAITTTLCLILLGALLIFAFEFNNEKTMKDFSLWQKVQASIFQSVTTRTAGFISLPQENLTDSSAIVSLLLMFIGGSPVATAGGIKTVTFVVLIAAALSAIKNKNDIELFSRSIPRQTVMKAMAVTTVFFAIVFVSTLLLSTVCDADLLDIMYETVSATATVGLSRSLTPNLNDLGKIIITLTMYLGRVGPISLAIALSFKKGNHNIIKNPIEDISVG